MILDERAEFADNVSVAAAAGTSIIGDVMDLYGSATWPSIPTTETFDTDGVYLVIQTGDTEIITGGAAGTLQFLLSTADDAALTTNVANVYTSAAYVTDDAGSNAAEFSANTTILRVELPKGTYRRYLGVRKVIATTTITAGTVNAFLTNDPGAWAAARDNVPELA